MSTPDPFDFEKRKRDREDEKRRQNPDNQPGKPQVDPPRENSNETEEDWARKPQPRR
jgi:hypothetical protein